MKKRIGILTGGGDCPGLNAVIRAAVRTAIRDHDMDVLGIQLGFEGLLTGSTVPLTAESIRGILPKGGTLLRTTAELAARGPSWPRATARPRRAPIREAISNLKYVDPDGEMVRTAQSIGISFGDGR